MTQENKNQPNKIVEGEDKKVNQEISKSVETIKEFNGSNENDVKVAQIVMENLTNQQKIRNEIKELELKQEQLIAEMDNDVKKRKDELSAKTRMIEVISTTTTAIVAIAGITTMSCLNTITQKEVKLEELRNN